MKMFVAVIRMTILELIRKKTFIANMIIMSLALVVYYFSGKTIKQDLLSAGRGEEMLMLVRMVQERFISGISGIGLLLPLIGGAGVFADMFIRGNTDMILAKPLPRSVYVLGRFSAAVLAMLLYITYVAVGVLLISGFSWGYWDGAVLYSILTVGFTYTALLGLALLLAVVFRSAPIGGVSAFIVLLFLSPLLASREPVLKALHNDFIRISLDILYYILPKSAEITDTITKRLIMGTGVPDWQPVLSTALLCIINIGASIALFEKRDL